MGNEQVYLVRGAMLSCRMGSHPRRLNLPQSHGEYICDHPVIMDEDCTIENMVKNKEALSEYTIKSINNLILKNIDNDNAGRYRTQNVIISGAEYIPPNHILVKEKMEEFISWYQKCENMHPVLNTAKVHVDFVGIHPFIDGNGRVSRLIMNLELLKSGYQAVNIRNDKKLGYYEALDTAHCKSDYSLFYKLTAEYELARLKEIVKVYKTA